MRPITRNYQKRLEREAEAAKKNSGLQASDNPSGEVGNSQGAVAAPAGGGGTVGAPSEPGNPNPEPGRLVSTDIAAATEKRTGALDNKEDTQAEGQEGVAKDIATTADNKRTEHPLQGADSLRGTSNPEEQDRKETPEEREQRLREEAELLDLQVRVDCLYQQYRIFAHEGIITNKQLDTQLYKRVVEQRQTDEYIAETLGVQLAKGEEARRKFKEEVNKRRQAEKEERSEEEKLQRDFELRKLKLQLEIQQAKSARREYSQHHPRDSGSTSSKRKNSSSPASDNNKKQAETRIDKPLSKDIDRDTEQTSSEKHEHTTSGFSTQTEGYLSTTATTRPAKDISGLSTQKQKPLAAAPSLINNQSNDDVPLDQRKKANPDIKPQQHSSGGSKAKNSTVETKPSHHPPQVTTKAAPQDTTQQRTPRERRPWPYFINTDCDFEDLCIPRGPSTLLNEHSSGNEHFPLFIGIVAVYHTQSRIVEAYQRFYTPAKLQLRRDQEEQGNSDEVRIIDSDADRIANRIFETEVFLPDSFLDHVPRNHPRKQLARDYRLYDLHQQATQAITQGNLSTSDSTNTADTKSVRSIGNIENFVRHIGLTEVERQDSRVSLEQRLQQHYLTFPYIARSAVNLSGRRAQSPPPEPQIVNAYPIIKRILEIFDREANRNDELFTAGYILARDPYSILLTEVFYNFTTFIGRKEFENISWSRQPARFAVPLFVPCNQDNSYSTIATNSGARILFAHRHVYPLRGNNGKKYSSFEESQKSQRISTGATVIVSQRHSELYDQQERRRQERDRQERDRPSARDNSQHSQRRGRSRTPPRSRPLTQDSSRRSRSRDQSSTSSREHRHTRDSSGYSDRRRRSRTPNQPRQDTTALVTVPPGRYIQIPHDAEQNAGLYLHISTGRLFLDLPEEFAQDINTASQQEGRSRRSRSHTSPQHITEQHRNNRHDWSRSPTPIDDPDDCLL